MISAFYNARSGAMAQDKTMNVISDNLANVSTVGFKGGKMGFSDLLYTNLHQPETVVDPLRTGNGVKNQQVGISFEQGAMQSTAYPYDFAIKGEGFFAVQSADDGQITYTRDGSFRLRAEEDGFYLANGQGDLVLDSDSAPIPVDVDMEEGEEDISPEMLNIGVFAFPNQYGLLKIGTNQFIPTEQSQPAEAVSNDVIVKGYLEGTNVDSTTEISRVIEAQRAFQFNSRIIQMSDELEQSINNLR